MRSSENIPESSTALWRWLSVVRGIRVDLRGFHRGPHRSPFGQTELRQRDGGDLGAHGDRFVDKHPYPITHEVDFAHPGRPRVPRAPRGSPRVQGDALGCDDHEAVSYTHLT